MSDDIPVLDVRGLTAGYSNVPVITDVSLKAYKGKVTAIVGPNGAGKSTLMKAIVGLIKCSSGSVRLNGTEVSGWAPERLVREGLAYVPQVVNVFPSLTIRENLEMGGYTRRSGLHERIEHIYSLFPDLKQASSRPARTLSGGQRHMLAMARGLMTDPSILILDEPTAGLAPKYAAGIWDHVKIAQSTGVGIVIVEQNTRRTLASADWAYVLVLGRNRLEGPGAELLEDPEVAQLYIGKG
ncbi:MAG TPA: ABC transporter ATP-binding protein [Clostridia bacterium]|nr:ABC transporter ATP-binding protein [Clostridia bacterium]